MLLDCHICADVARVVYELNFIECFMCFDKLLYRTAIGFTSLLPQGLYYLTLHNPAGSTPQPPSKLQLINYN